MSLYHILTIIKIVLWIWILLIVGFTIDPTLDPAIWLAFWFWGIFMTIRWISFYIFLLSKKLFNKKKLTNEEIAIDSYKMSLLFWLYVIINLLIMYQWRWTKGLWIILFILFIIIQILISLKPEWEEELKREF